jgi:hypothetical protein
MTKGHFPLGELGLGAFTPFESDKVVILNLFGFNKERGEIVKQSHKKIKLQGIP